MKRKLIASLLCLCMLVSLLPVAAFATEPNVEAGGTTESKTAPAVIAANIVDKNSNPLKGDNLYTGTPTATLDNSTNTITVTVNNLARHKASDEAGMGYWVGVGIPLKTGDTYAVGWGEGKNLQDTDYGAKNDSKQTIEGFEQEYATFYFDAIKGDTAYISVKSTPATKDGETATGTTTTYKVDLSNVTLKLDVAPANLTGATDNRPQGNNADVYTVTGVREAKKAPVITVKATELKKHKNSNNLDGNWVGVALPQITGAEYAWGFGSYDPTKVASFKASTRTQDIKDVTYDTFYFSDDETDKWTDGGYIAVQLKKEGTVVATYHYDIVFDVTPYSGAAIKGMGFNADAATAQNFINSAEVGLENKVSDCDSNTMYVYFNDVVSGTTDAPATLTVQNANKDTVYTWKSTAAGTVARVVYFTFNQDNGGSPSAKPIASGEYTATLKIGDKTTTAKLTLNSVTINKADGTQDVQTTTYYENGAKFTLADNLTKANSVFTGWKDDKDATVAAGEKTVTADVTYTAQWDDVRIDKDKTVSLQQTVNAEQVNVAGVTATVTEDTTAKTGVITLTGSITEPTDKTNGATYKLAYTTNAKSANEGSFDVTLKVENGKVVPTIAGGKATVGAYTYTVDTTALKVLPTNVKIVDSGAATVTEDQVTSTGLTDDNAKQFVADVKKTTGSFDTQNSTLSEKLTTEATKLTKESADSMLTEAKKDAAQGTAETYTTLAVVPVLQIEQAKCDGTAKTVTMEITPAVQYQAVSTNNQNANIPIGNPIPLDKAEAAKIGTVTITFEKPVFVTGTPADDSKLYVTHKASTGLYEYDANWDKTKSVYTFDNPHGFSEFVVSETSKAVATIGTAPNIVKYGDLQSAVDAVEDNGTIKIVSDTPGTATVGKAVTINFTMADGCTADLTKLLTATGSFKLDEGYPKTEGSITTYKFVKTGGTDNGGGGGGVSSNVTIDRPTNGKVTVTPTAPSKGATVTINLTPDTGYTVGTVTVTDKDGKAVELTKVNDTQYTFTMPDGKVTVKATFTKVDTPPATGFTDVPADAYYADAVKWAVDNGITNGLTATTFGPNNSCTRGQMVTFLWRAAGSPAATGTNSFSDVASGEYYYNAVLWAVEKGITNGTSATTFSPNATVNRGQTVTFLYRYAESPAATGDTSFTDVAADAFYADAVKWAVAEGITNGTSDTTFAPASNCTRGQIVTFMYRQMAE